jgi:hypothetical protein
VPCPTPQSDDTVAWFLQPARYFLHCVKCPKNKLAYFEEFVPSLDLANMFVSQII